MLSEKMFKPYHASSDASLFSFSPQDLLNAALLFKLTKFTIIKCFLYLYLMNVVKGFLLLQLLWKNCSVASSLLSE